MDYILPFAVVLGVLIFFHELGHFLVARLFGVGVEKFSLGFGPRLFGKTIDGTDYRISAIPLGGYVKMVGEEPDAEIAPEDIPRSFTHQHVFKRICIVAAGPLFNLLLAIVIFYGFFQLYGVHIRLPVVGEVTKGMPADSSGLQKGDQVVAIDGSSIESWDEMAQAIMESGGKPLELLVQREGETVRVVITPALQPATDLFGQETERYVIGIASSSEYMTRALNPFEALAESLSHTYRVTELTVLAVVKLITGEISSKNLGGPIMIAQMAGDQAREGMDHLINLIAFISINLAILNFLPIPVLDGGHLFFFFIEAIKGKPVSIRVREIAQQGGMFILLLLMIFVIYNDIDRINAVEQILKFFGAG